MSAAQKETPGSVAGATDQAQEQVDGRIVGESRDHAKALATIQAQLALRGFALYALNCGGYLIARWDRSTFAPDLRAASAFLERIS